MLQPPPHPLVDSSGGQRFLVERVLNHRDMNGVRTSYLVRWRGYPPAWDSWEPRVQLIVDVLGLFEQYDETHPLRSKKDVGKRPPQTRVQGLQSVDPFAHLGRDARPSVGIIWEVSLLGTRFELSRQPGHESPHERHGNPASRGSRDNLYRTPTGLRFSDLMQAASSLTSQASRPMHLMLWMKAFRPCTKALPSRPRLPL
uniref:Chromo domain-containing protein n=1 Tax=Peronospora matthiolae TaxID=2874970 RepID=A0AAV1T7I0_9STRA